MANGRDRREPSFRRARPRSGGAGFSPFAGRSGRGHHGAEARVSRQRRGLGPSRRPRGRENRTPASGARRSIWSRLFYAGVVLCLWGVIAVGGVVAYYASQLPPIDELTVPKRPPNIAIMASDGIAARQQGRDRRAHGVDRRIAALPAEGVRRHRGPALLRPLGHRPGRHRPRALSQRQSRRRCAGRLDPDPAARQEPLPDAGAHRLAQDPGGDPRPLAGAQLHQGPDPRTLSQPGLFRRRRLWRRGGGAALLRQVGAQRVPLGGGGAGRPRAGARPGSRPTAIPTPRRPAPNW